MWKFSVDEQLKAAGAKACTGNTKSGEKAPEYEEGAEWIGMENGRLVTYRYMNGSYEKTGYLNAISLNPEDELK